MVNNTYSSVCMACNWVDINWTKREAGASVLAHQITTGHAVTTEYETTDLANALRTVISKEGN